MRIRKGNQVEVWIQEAGSPVGAWRVGEVTWGNGHSYTLRWHDGGDVSGRITRKSVRPRPPPAPVPRDLDAGDMVEVFDDDDCLWKCAEVQGAAGGGDYLRFDVKIVGAAKVLTVPSQRLRVRLVLRDDDVWVALHKDNQVPVRSAMLPRAYGGSVGLGIGRGKGGQPGFTPLLQKRSFGMLGPNTNPHGDDGRFEDNTKRLKGEPRYGVEVLVPKVSLNKEVEMSGEDCNSDDDEQQQQQQHERKDDEEEEEEEDSDSSSSSDDSSSSSESDSRTRSIEAGEDCAAAPTIKPCNNDQEADQLQPSKKEHCDDIIAEAESRGVGIKREPLNDQMGTDGIAESGGGIVKREPLNDPMGTMTEPENIHRLGLEAYAALMKAFHARGNALSWENEELLSDARGQLRISNEEHRQMLNVILNRKGRVGAPHRRF